jgi:hypothetical protein
MIRILARIGSATIVVGAGVAILASGQQVAGHAIPASTTLPECTTWELSMQAASVKYGEDMRLACIESLAV